ncbi:sigma-70 family RNA polymerase sigma factor [Bifidobacterium longum]
MDVHIQSKETCLQNCGAGPSTEFCCFANKNELMAPHAVKRSVCFGSFWCGSPISRYRREGVVVKLVFKHEANRAGNTSESDVYDLTEEEMQSMLERDRILRAVDARCSPEELAFRHPQTILQDVWNIEERNAHAYHRSDRASGALISYDELVAVDCDCISAATDPESIIIERESEAERKRILQCVNNALSRLPVKQRDVIVGIFLQGQSQADMARSIGVSRAAISKQVASAMGNLRKALARLDSECAVKGS